MKVACVAIVLAVALLSIGCKSGSQTQTQATPSPTAENYPNLTAKAKEISDAFTNKDYMKVLELTYPKAIEMGGGRDKMIATMKEGLKEDNLIFLSTVPGAPTQILHEGNSIYAVVPITTRIKAQDGVFESYSTLIGISSDGGANWTFIDAAGEDSNDLRVLPATTLAKIKLPPEKDPVKISG